MPSLSSPVRPLTLAVCAALAALSAVSAFADEARLGEVLVSSGRDSAAPVNAAISRAMPIMLSRCCTKRTGRPLPPR